jgi:hypothetical protein
MPSSLFAAPLPAIVSSPSPVTACSIVVPAVMPKLPPARVEVDPAARRTTALPVTAAASIQSVPPSVSARLRRPSCAARAATSPNSSV